MWEGSCGFGAQHGSAGGKNLSQVYSVSISDVSRDLAAGVNLYLDSGGIHIDSTILLKLSEKYPTGENSFSGADSWCAH